MTAGADQPYQQPPMWATGPAPWQWGGPRLAEFGPRLLAYIIDWVIVYVPMLAVFGIGFVLGIVASAANEAVALLFMFGIMLVYFAAVFGLPILYHAHFVARDGQTPGRRIAGVRVVDMSTGLPPTYGKAALRQFIGIIASSQVFLLGYLWMLWDDQKRTWHDMVANTVVIDAPKR